LTGSSFRSTTVFESVADEAPARRFDDGALALHVGERAVVLPKGTHRRHGERPRAVTKRVFVAFCTALILTSEIVAWRYVTLTVELALPTATVTSTVPKPGGAATRTEERRDSGVDATATSRNAEADGDGEGARDADSEGEGARVGVRPRVEDGAIDGDGDGVMDGEGVMDGDGAMQLRSVTKPAVPLAPRPVARPVALPVVADNTTLGLTYDEPPPPEA
jgi:hypothetical protein